jgi:hypothetical protein
VSASEPSNRPNNKSVINTNDPTLLGKRELAEGANGHTGINKTL